MAAVTALDEIRKVRCGRIGGILLPHAAVAPPAALAGMRAALGPGAQLLNEQQCIADVAETDLLKRKPAEHGPDHRQGDDGAPPSQRNRPAATGLG